VARLRKTGVTSHNSSYVHRRLRRRLALVRLGAASHTSDTLYAIAPNPDMLHNILLCLKMNEVLAV